MIFKNWKSNFALDDIPPFKRERVLCTLYARLIFIFLTHRLASLARTNIWTKQHREVSLFRACKYLKTVALDWLKALWLQKNTVFALKNQLGFIEKYCLKSKQNTRIYPLEIMEFLDLMTNDSRAQKNLDFVTYVNRNYATLCNE